MKLSDHRGYIKAVVGALESLGMETGRLSDMATTPVVVLDDDFDRWYSGAQDRRNRSPHPVVPREPRRATSIAIPAWYAWPWYEPIDVSADMAWDEEFGWIVTKLVEINAGPGRGRASRHYGLGLGLVPDPIEVALRVETVFTTKGGPPFSSSPCQLRNAADYHPDLEMALAAYLPT